LIVDWIALSTEKSKLNDGIVVSLYLTLRIGNADEEKLQAGCVADIGLNGNVLP